MTAEIKVEKSEKALFFKGLVCYAKLFGFYLIGHVVALNLFKK